VAPHTWRHAADGGRTTSGTASSCSPWQRPVRPWRRNAASSATSRCPSTGSTTTESWRPTTTTTKIPAPRRPERNSCDSCHVTWFGWTRDWRRRSRRERRPEPCAVLHSKQRNVIHSALQINDSSSPPPYGQGLDSKGGLAVPGPSSWWNALPTNIRT